MKIQQTDKYKLSIQLSLDGFSFLIFDAEKNRIVREKEVVYTQEDNFYDWLKVKLVAEDLLKRKYASTQILFCTEKQTLVPKEFAKDTKDKDLFAVNFPLEKTEMIMSEDINDIVILSALNSDMYNLIKDYFPKAKWKTIPLFLLEQTQTPKEWNVKLLLLKNRLHIVTNNNDKVQLCNSFPFQTKDDLLYYILYVFDNLDIPVANSSIRLWGNQDYCELMSETLERYHSDVQLTKNTLKISSKTALGRLLLSNL